MNTSIVEPLLVTEPQAAKMLSISPASLERCVTVVRFKASSLAKSASAMPLRSYGHWLKRQGTGLSSAT